MRFYEIKRGIYNISSLRGIANAEAIHTLIRHTEGNSAKYPNHTNLKNWRINAQKANQSNLALQIGVCRAREYYTFGKSQK